jgi:hypothetical protein
MSKRVLTGLGLGVLALGLLYGGLDIAGAAPTGGTVTVVNTAPTDDRPCRGRDEVSGSCCGMVPTAWWDAQMAPGVCGADRS